MEEYLNFAELELSPERLESTGVFKLFLIRQMSLHYRHLLKCMRKINKVIENVRVREIALEYSKPDLVLRRFVNRIRGLHKLPRTKEGIRYRVIFDFDGTITKIVKNCQQNRFDIKQYIYDQITSNIRSIVKKEFFDYFYNKDSFGNFLKFEIISASGDRSGIVNFLRRNKIESLFDNIIATSGVVEKIRMIYKKTSVSKNRFWFIVDDDTDLLNLYKILLVFPLKCDEKGRIKKHLECYD